MSTSVSIRKTMGALANVSTQLEGTNVIVLVEPTVTTPSEAAAPSSQLQPEGSNIGGRNVETEVFQAKSGTTIRKSLRKEVKKSKKSAYLQHRVRNGRQCEKWNIHSKAFCPRIYVIRGAELFVIENRRAKHAGVAESFVWYITTLDL
ncbi:hypothetical protein EJB05_49545, partial [Eragrostis curvula]